MLLGATGGTARHSLVLEHALRPVFTYLRAVVVPTSVFAATDDWAGDARAGAAARPDRARGAASSPPRSTVAEPATAPDPFALTTSFDQLLAAE